MRFWVVQHPHNLDLYYADCPPERTWTCDSLFALRFHCEDSALTYMVCNLGGKGHAVEIVLPRSVIAA